MELTVSTTLPSFAAGRSSCGAQGHAHSGREWMQMTVARFLWALCFLGACSITESPSALAGDEADWSTSILNWGETPWHAAPVDISFLNSKEKPAGRHGFLKNVNGNLVFEDGTPARFWGTNLTAQALFGMALREDVRLQARRLSQLGFNLVRLHHHDSYWVKPNIFGAGIANDTKTLSPAMLERLDWWIKCLKDEGIYVWLDLEVQRQFRRGDGITDFEEISKGKPGADLKGFNYVNDSIQQAMQAFDDAYVNHINSFTSLRYKDDPAIAVMLLTNENDVTHHFGNRLLPDKGFARHSARFMAAADAFAEKYALPKDKVWRSWEPGPAKLFLNDLEHRFDRSLIDRLRAGGVKCPIVTTSYWGGPLSSVPVLATGDLIDVHSYGTTGELDRNPLKAADMVHWIAAAHVVGRPLSVSEWNVEPFPVPDRHVIPIFMAGSASLQGWNAVMQYAYSQQPLDNRGRPSNWQAFNDPALMATLPAAALLYRRGDVRESETVYAFSPSKAQLFDEPISPDNAVALRTAAEKGKLLMVLPSARELPWLEKSRIPERATIIADPQRSLIESDARSVTSDTGELHRDWEDGNLYDKHRAHRGGLGTYRRPSDPSRGYRYHRPHRDRNGGGAEPRRKSN